MLHNIIKYKKELWLNSTDCPVIDLVNYIKGNGNLREAQIEAIETYLFLKICGDNKPLHKLFKEGFFIDSNNSDLERLNINQDARVYLKENTAAYSLFDFARTKINQKIILPELEKLIIDDPKSVDYDEVINNFFYGVDYADYLMSLPMGAGKTFLMAAFIYIDLYFANLEPLNKNFAHNFLVLIPSGLKSSIVPSLRTIENFDPAWVIPEPSASALKRILNFDVLDEPKSAKKSNRARNPNAQKVNSCLPNPFGHVFVVNAEKVILESFRFNAQSKIEFNEDEEETNNDLKKLFAQIPNLSILIDEVHHAATDDIKLRQAVNYWNKNGSITTVLGFSGTPYLQPAETIVAGNLSFKFSQITNTVYYYPLITAIRKFLKTPTVKIATNLDRFEIIRNGIQDFNKIYKKKRYKNGCISKLAIYCSNIEVLEEEVFPFLVNDLKINPSEILKYHGGNKVYNLPKENELEFRSLDQPFSKKRYILLVQVGKEGWDCPSLTGVILSQKGDCPQNMILQTSCRCLRQVDKGTDETALIWLNRENADVLNKQLKQEQNSSIDELNNAKKQTIERIDRHSRMEYLELPPIDFFQMKVTYKSINEESHANTEVKLKQILSDINQYKNAALISTSLLDTLQNGIIDTIEHVNGDFTTFENWLYDIHKESFQSIKLSDLEAHNTILTSIFNTITSNVDNTIVFNLLFDTNKINSDIRLSFTIKRTLETESEVIPQDAELLITNNLTSVEKNDSLIPEIIDLNKIIELDKTGASVEIDEKEILKAYETLKSTLIAQGMENFLPAFDSFKLQFENSIIVKSKNQSFHYMPYNFGSSGSSGFEGRTLTDILRLKTFTENNLELYYNGERGLTEFVINCFAKEGNVWRNIGRYTTDFLIIKRRKKDSIHKVLMIETKGSIFANDAIFKLKKKFVETQFLELNRDRFGYQKFDFLYLEDTIDFPSKMSKLSEKIENFFKD